MLYDNALLARAYLHGWQASGQLRLREVCRGTLDWVLDEMRGPEGAFYSALDADSEGAEGSYYIWSPRAARGARRRRRRRDRLARRLPEQGNFLDPHDPQRGLNVLQDRGLTAGRAARVDPRTAAGRTRPARAPGTRRQAVDELERADDQRPGRRRVGALEPRYLQAGEQAADFLLEQMRDGQGRLLRTYNQGQAKLTAYLEDHAFLLEALLALFEASCETRRLEQAQSWPSR